MTAAALLAELDSLGVTVVPVGNRLRYRPRAAVPSRLVEALADRAAEVEQLLRSRDSAGSRLTTRPSAAPRAHRLEVAPYRAPSYPVRLNAWTVVTDPTKAIRADLCSLESVVAALDECSVRGEREGLLEYADTLIERLTALGVHARIEAIQ